MATLGNYGAALGGMAKEAITGTAKGLVGGLKGAMIREAPGLAGAYAFGKDLNKRANSQSSLPRMSGGNAPSPSPSQSPSGVSSPLGGLSQALSIVPSGASSLVPSGASSLVPSGASSPLGGLSQAVSLVAGQHKSNIINLEEVRQLKQLNANVINQSKLISFQVQDTRQKNLFAEEVANEQAIRDDKLLDAINKLSDKFDAASFGGKNKADGEGGGGLVGAAGSVAASVAGGFLKDGLKWIGGAIISAIAAGWLFFKRQIAAFALTAALQFGGGAALGGAVAGAGAGSAIMGTLGTIVPMVLRFLTGPVGLGIMAAAGIGAYLYSKRDPEKAAAASANSAVKKLKNQPSETEGQLAKAPLKQDEAKVLLEQRAEREKVAAEAEAKAAEMEKSATATKQQKETAKKYAEGRREAVDYDIKPWGGLDRVQRVAAGQPDPGGAISTGKFLDKVRGAESGGKNIQNPLGGTAGGVYQITDSTWTGNVEKMIAGGDTRFTKADLDPNMKFNEAKARMVAEYITEQNRVGLKNALKRDPTETDLYMAYFLGMGGTNSGAIRFLNEMDKDPAQVAWKLSSTSADSDIINNNAEIFFEKVSRDPKDRRKVLSKEGPRSVKAVYELMNKKISGAGGGNAAVVAGGAKTSAPENASETKKKRPATKAEINNKDVNEFYAKGDSPFETHGGGLLLSKVGMPQSGGGGDDGDTKTKSLSGGGDGGGTKLVAKNAPIKTEDDKLRKVTENIAKQQGIDPKKSNATQTPTQKQRETARLTTVIKPLYKSNTQLINETNQKFLQQFKSTATSAFTQGLTKTLFPKGFGVSAATAGADNNYRGQQLQKIFGTDKVINDATTKLLGKKYGPMFAPLFNNLAQGYLEVGSRIAGGKIFQTLGGLGAEETQTLTGQVLGNYAAGNKKLALEQLLYGASGGSKSGIALGPETLLAKYGFKTPQEGIAYFAGGLADMATAPLANLMGGDPTNGVRFDNRTKKYYNRDGTEATPAEYAAASRQYGASINQGPLFSVGNDNYSGRGQPGTTQMQGGTVVQGYGQQYGPQPGQFRVVAPTVNSITGVSTAPTLPQALGLTAQTVAGFSKEQLDAAEAQVELAKIAGVKRAEEAKALLISNAEAQAQAKGLAKDDAEYNRMIAVASDRGNAIVTMEAAKYTVSGLGGQTAGGGSATPGTTPKPGDAGYRPGQLFQKDSTDGPGMQFGKEVGNFAFDMGKNMLGQQLTKGIKNPYMQMVANFAIQKGLNYGFEALFGKGGFDIGKMFDSGIGSIKDFFGFGSSAATSAVTDTIVSDTAANFIPEAFSWLAADGGIATQATPGVFGEKGAEAIIPLSNPTATKALSTAMGTDKTLSSLGDQTDLLSSIDKSLLTISGKTAGSGTNIGGGSLSSSGSLYTGSGGLGGIWNPTSTSAGLKPGVNAGRPGAPSTMDIVGSIAGSIAKSYVIKTAIGAALNLAVPGTTAALAAGFEGGLVAGVSNAVGMVPGFASAAVSNITGVLASGASSVASALGATETAAAFASEGLIAGLTAMGPVGWAGLAVVGIAAAIGYGGGGGGSSPPPKEPKFHAAIYVTGNNNIDAIAPVYETTDYHAVPDVYKTIAYGLLRVAFNAAKAAEQVTKMTPPFDYLYIKVEFNRISLCWGKGAPNANTLATSDANQVGSWGPPSKDQNLNSVASDIVNLINSEFKKSASASNLTKLDTAAKALGNMTLDQLSSGLIQDLKTGEFKLDKNVQKGIFANDVGESNRIASLISAAKSNSGKLSDEGTPLIWSMKDNAYIDASSAPGALLLDAQGRPVYDIPGTSAGLTAEDFGGTDVVGIDRPANLYSPTTGTVTSGSDSGGTVISAPSTTKIDNSAVNNFYNNVSNSLDKLRSTGPG